MLQRTKKECDWKSQLADLKFSLPSIDLLKLSYFYYVTGGYMRKIQVLGTMILIMKITSTFAAVNVCEEIKNSGYVFANYSSPHITIQMGPGNTGEVQYEGERYPLTISSCVYNYVILDVQEGQIIGNLGMSADESRWFNAEGNVANHRISELLSTPVHGKGGGR